MNTEKLILISKGMLKRIPGLTHKPSGTGGTIESRYCYSVWLRHLLKWNHVYKTIPETVAELGPGDSLGIGLAALLSGCEHLFALDVIKYWDNDRNLRIFDELTSLFCNREKIPDNDEYPRIRPVPASFIFPSGILDNSLLDKSLSVARVDAIKREITDINNPDNSYIKYKIPWFDTGIIEADSIEFIFSQAVLECIDDLDHTYNAMHQWLKPGGLMSHTIDLKSHLTKEWNGQWQFSDMEWNMVKGSKEYLFNRLPYSEYLNYQSTYGFETIILEKSRNENHLKREQLAEKFRNLSEDDITTSGVYILSRKL